jgi:predicted permease
MSNQYPKVGAGGAESNNSGVPDYFDRRRDVSVYEEQALFNRSSVSIGQDGLPTRIRAINATPSFFKVMKVSPILGRTFSDEEGEQGAEKKVVLSESFWRSQLAGDPQVLGRELRLDSQPYTVVGVMPRSFEALSPGVTLWRPLAFTAEQKSDESRHSNSWWNVGRLKPGATLEQAQAQVNALNAANLERFVQYKELLINAGFHTKVSRLQDVLVREVRPTLYLLWGGALFVLLIGCLNVANLSLVRARARLKELATRLALGAGRAQLARQLVVEGVLLTLAAAAAGLVLGGLALRLLGALDLQDLPYASEIRLDGVAVAFTLLLSLAIGLALGLLPVASVLPANLAGVLREEGRGTSSARGARELRRLLVVGQVAFTFVLLLGAGLLFASYRRVLEVDPGFVAERVLTASVTLPRSRYAEEPALRAFADESLRRVRALPGVLQLGATDTIPFGSSSNDSVILAEGYELKPGESLISPNAVVVTPGYFEAMGVKLREGRFFQDGDTAGALPVVIVDARLARHFWPDQSPLGRRLYLPTDINNLLAVTDKTVFLTVVGVIEDMTLHDFTEGAKTVGAYYFPGGQVELRHLTFTIKTAGQPESLTASLRQAIAALDPELPVYDVESMALRADRGLLNRRTPALLSLGFGAVALLLSSIGIYGVLAYLVSQRRKEIGIRMALGSTAAAIFRLVLREGVLLVALGLLIGAAGALALRRSLESQLYGVRAGDPLVLAGVTALLALAALLACVLPARRATHIDPNLALSE